MPDVPAIPKHPGIEELSYDGWMSAVTGMGVLGKDKNEGTTFARRTRRHHEVLDAMYRQDPLASNIVDAVVDDALREGFKINFTAQDDEEGLDAEQVNDILAKVTEWQHTVVLGRQIKEHLKQARTFGGSVLVFGVDDRSPDPALPLEEERMVSFDYLKALDRFQLASSGLLDTDPRSPNFGFPVFYHLHSVFGSTNLITSATQEPGAQEEIVGIPTINNTTVHWSRMWRSDGIILSDRSRLNNDGWGDSILERCWDPLRNWNTAMAGSASLIHDFAQGVYGIKGLSQIIAANQESLLKKRFQVMDVIKSIWNATFIDADGESYERKSTNVTGLPDLIDRHGVHLAASARMPLTRILGISPGGFGTGEAESNNWDDVVKAYQQEVVKPILVRIFTLLFATPDFAAVPDAWDIEFHPLRQMSQEQQATIHKTQAEADAIYITIGVLSPGEVAQSRFGGEKYSVDTTLDDDARQELPDDEVLEGEVEETTDPVEPEEVPDTVEPAEPVVEEAADPGTAFNGAQVQALAGIVLQVVNDEIPFESAVQLVAISFPVDEAAARSLLAPAKAQADSTRPAREAAKTAMTALAVKGAAGGDDSPEDGDGEEEPPAAPEPPTPPGEDDGEEEEA